MQVSPRLSAPSEPSTGPSWRSCFFTARPPTPIQTVWLELSNPPRTGLVKEVFGSFREHQLLIAAGGIAFRVFLALVTGTLMTVGLVGLFGLEDLWREDFAPDVKRAVSQPAYELMDKAVTSVFNSKQTFWVTLGAMAALWQISGVVRASGQTLNRVYGCEDDRSLWEELRSSVLVGALIALLMVGALVIVRFGGILAEEALGTGTAVGVLSFVVRWALAGALLLLVVGLIARTGPGIERPLRWVGFGSLLTVGGWVVLTILFGLYLTEIADFGNVYGSLLTAFLGFEYLYIASIVFLGGLVVDRIAQENAGA